MAFEGPSQMDWAAYIMRRSLITDTFVISRRKKKNVHFGAGEASKEREGEGEGRVNKPRVPQPPQNSSFTEKKYPKTQRRANLIQEE